jgi:hypothetical protein
LSDLASFFWGFAGSVAVEIGTFYQAYMTEPIRLPERYKRPDFWIVRLFLAVVAGGIAMAEGVNTEISAITVGAAAPLVLEKLAKGLES